MTLAARRTPATTPYALTIGVTADSETYDRRALDVVCGLARRAEQRLHAVIEQRRRLLEQRARQQAEHDGEDQRHEEERRDGDPHEDDHPVAEGGDEQQGQFGQGVHGDSFVYGARPGIISRRPTGQYSPRLTKAQHRRRERAEAAISRRCPRFGLRTAAPSGPACLSRPPSRPYGRRCARRRVGGRTRSIACRRGACRPPGRSRFRRARRRRRAPTSGPRRRSHDRGQRHVAIIRPDLQRD